MAPNRNLTKMDNSPHVFCRSACPVCSLSASLLCPRYTIARVTTLISAEMPASKKVNTSAYTKPTCAGEVSDKLLVLLRLHVCLGDGCRSFRRHSPQTSPRPLYTDEYVHV